jgi:aminoglycoside phosphotransferase (APT) family kinase protein
VDDPELAATLAAAGAELADSEPDVETAPTGRVSGEAQHAIVVLEGDDTRSGARFARAARRAAGTVTLRARAAKARAALRRRGYASTVVIGWERGVPFTRDRTVAKRSPAAHRFPLNGVVVGARSAAGETAFDAAHAHARERIGEHFDVGTRVMGASGVVIGLADDFVLRVAVGPGGRRLEEQEAALAALAAEDPPALVADRVPWVVASGRTGLTSWSLERRIDGARPPMRLREPLLTDCWDFIQALHRLGRGRPDARLPLIHARAIASRIHEEEAAARLGAAADHVERVLRDVPRGFSHGDFWTGNVLVDRHHRLAGVVDWSGATAGSLPILDLLHLAVTATREQTGRTLGDVVVNDYLRPERSGTETVISAHCRAIGLDVRVDERAALVSAYWLQAVAHELVDPDRDPNLARREGWRRANVDVVLDAIAAQHDSSTAGDDGRRGGNSRCAASP